jgi:hypothetical protein
VQVEHAPGMAFFVILLLLLAGPLAYFYGVDSRPRP